MKDKHINLLFAVIAILLFAYTFVFVNETHNFVINAGWETNLIEAKWLFYLIAGMGLCLYGFYYFFGSLLYSQELIYIHIISYILLAIVLILWDNNSFSLQEAVDSQSYNSVRHMRSDFHNTLDRLIIYRYLFWILLLIQPIGLLNLMLGFIKSNPK